MVKNYKKGLSAVGIAKGNRGFTLIELLVVIAIIGVLASVVLISTSETRNSGKDAAVQSNLKTAMLQAEIYNTKNGCYDDCSAAAATTCASILNDGIFAKALEKAADSSPDTDATCTASINSTDIAVSLTSPIKTTTTPADNIWCADSNGTFEKGTKSSKDGLCS